MSKNSKTVVAKPVKKVATKAAAKPAAEKSAAKTVKAPAKKAAPKAEKPAKPVVRTIPTFEDIKKQLEAWAETNRIPGKIQAWYTAESLPEHSDWRIIKTYRGKQESLTIDAPARDMKAPELVTRVFEQLKKEHLHIFSKALRQIWFRAVGDGNYALLLKNMKLTETDIRNYYETDEVETTVSVLSTAEVLKGDVTGEGNVNAADVTALVNYILGKGTLANVAAAYVNDDTKIDIQDVTALIGIIKNM